MPRKRKHKLLQLVLMGAILLAGILSIRTLSYTSRQIRVTPESIPAMDPAAAERLAQALRFPTISLQPIDSQAFLSLDTFLAGNFPLSDSLLHRHTIAGLSTILEWPGKQAALDPILLLAHKDVVPPDSGSLHRWTYPPFAGTRAEQSVWGRGAIDDKGSLLAIMEAVEILLKEGYQPNRSIWFAFGHDEETGGSEGAAAMARWFADKNITFEYILDEGMLLVEDGGGGIQQPLAVIGIAEKGMLTLKLQAITEGGHSSRPPKETAVGMLAEAIYKLQENPFPARLDGATRLMLEYIGPETKMPEKIAFANLWLSKNLIINQLEKNPGTNAMLRTTIAPTIFKAGVKSNVLPAQAEAFVNFRILPGDTPESVTERVKKIVDNPGVSISVHDAEDHTPPSPVSSTETLGFRVIEKTIREIFPDAVVAPGLVIAGTDSKHYHDLARGTYRFMPLSLKNEELSQFHGNDERITEEDYADMIHFYRQLILNSAK